MWKEGTTSASTKKELLSDPVHLGICGRSHDCISAWVGVVAILACLITRKMVLAGGALFRSSIRVSS
jgi:hypothetical protein